MLPITQYTNEDLPYNDSTDFEVVYRINPLCIAILDLLPQQALKAAANRGLTFPMENRT